MPIKNVLLIYKKSAYAIYHHQVKHSSAFHKDRIVSDKINHIIAAHEEHYETLAYVEHVLKKLGITYTKRLRKRPIDYTKYQFIITVGGDGTFLETSRFVRKQLMVGVNSSPRYSVGKLCRARKSNFEKMMLRVMKGRHTVETLHRMRIRYNQNQDFVDCLNELLVTDLNPAVMSRYFLIVNDVGEEQYGSGLWISTASGSSGALKSAGGKVMRPTEKRMQYLPRELYEGLDKRYQLTGGLLNPSDKVRIISFMKDGMLYVDGNHCSIPFPYGTSIHVTLSPLPIRTIRWH
jgi:NAD+ kinase